MYFFMQYLKFLSFYLLYLFIKRSKIISDINWIDFKFLLHFINFKDSIYIFSFTTPFISWRISFKPFFIISENCWLLNVTLLNLISISALLINSVISGTIPLSTLGSVSFSGTTILSSPSSSVSSSMSTLSNLLPSSS